MSWRLLFLILLLAFGASALGGLQLGDWLVAHAPVAAPVPGQDAADPDKVVLDADGKPFVAQPPQPLVDGTLGVPSAPGGTRWQVPTVSLFETVTDPGVNIARDSLSASEVMRLSEAGAALPQGPADVVTVDIAQPGEGSRPQPPMPEQPPLQPQYPIPGQPPYMAQAAQGGQAVAPRPAAPAQAPAQQQDWLAALRNELQHCATLGFFQRPSCAWNARNKYCAPNRAWGSVAECPRRAFD